jgi:hypothetical protein
MRHIPEDELHAYLDQALSRAQAVEIERHLAGCATCRSQRDGIAGLRDRTTALLATLAPAHTVQRPGWGELRRRHHERIARRANLVRGAVWAASLVGALGLGYGAHSWRDTVAAAGTPTDGTPTVAVTELPVERPAPPVVATRRPVPRPAPDRTIAVETPVPAGSAPGVWRSESYERAVAAGYIVPRVAGLPVLQIQVQEASSPLVAVDQQLLTGEVVRMISGPAREIAAIDQSAAATASLEPANGGRSTVSARTGNRALLMTGRIPQDSLRALMARVRTE